MARVLPKKEKRKKWGSASLRNQCSGQLSAANESPANLFAVQMKNKNRKRGGRVQKYASRNYIEIDVLKISGGPVKKT